MTVHAIPAFDDERAPESLTTHDFTYDLPDGLIAKAPLAERTASRLLVIKPQADLVHGQFADVEHLLQAGDVLVVNDTRVIPARLYGYKESGGKAEVLLVRAEESAASQPTPCTWVALVQSSKRVKQGGKIYFYADALTTQNPQQALLSATVLSSVDDEPGAYLLQFSQSPLAYADQYGQLPLPPYMERAPNDDDKSRYQTIYSDTQKSSSSAAPTAGLHFDAALLKRLDNKGVKRVHVTLHVGPGTFFPVREGAIKDHKMHAEPWTVSDESAAILNQAKQEGRRIIAVGTTSLRTLESCVDHQGVFHAGQGLTRIFIHPGIQIRSVDALITNFHLPESTLLMLVAALVGRKRILAAYQEAVAHQYRFFSYGDASFVEVDPRAKLPSAYRSR